MVTPESPTGQQLALAYADRSAGQEANLAAGTSAYRDTTARVEAAVVTLISAGKPFTSNEVRDELERDGKGDYDPRNVASYMGVLAARHVIVEYPRPRVAAKRRPSRARKVTWWIGAAYADRKPAA